MLGFYLKKSVVLLFAAVTLNIANGHDAETGFPSTKGDLPGSFAASLATRYESNYYSEGRDSLDGDAIWVNSIEFGYGLISGAVWYGDSPSQDYDELQLSIGLSGTVGIIDLSLGFTHLEFPYDHSDDQEIGLAIGFSELPWGTELAADLYYSFGAGGCFAEFSVSKGVVENEHMSLNLAGLFGMNQGYVVDGHDGANHVAIRLETEIPIWDQLCLNLHAAYSWAISSDAALDGDAQLVDFLHGSAGLVWEF